MHPRPLGCHPKYRMPSRRDNVQAVKSSGTQGYPRSTPPFLGGLGGSQSPEPPFSLVPSTARSLFGGTKRECGVESVGSVNSHALADKEQGNLRPKYAKRVPALRLGLFCRSLRRGTFHRRKVPKDRWGVSMRPRPLTTPQSPEGCMLGAPRDAMIKHFVYLNDIAASAVLLTFWEKGL